MHFQKVLLCLVLMISFQTQAQSALTASQFQSLTGWLSYFSKQASMKKSETKFKEFVQSGLVHEEDRVRMSEFLSGEAALSDHSFQFFYNEVWILDDQDGVVSKLALTDTANVYMINEKKLTFDPKLSVTRQLQLLFGPTKKHRKNVYLELLSPSSLHAEELCFTDSCVKRRELEEAYIGLLSSMSRVLTQKQDFANLKNENQNNCPQNQEPIQHQAKIDGKNLLLKNFYDKTQNLTTEVTEKGGKKITQFKLKITPSAPNRTLNISNVKIESKPQISSQPNLETENLKIMSFRTCCETQICKQSQSIPQRTPSNK